MKVLARVLIAVVILSVVGYFGWMYADDYWKHRYDALIDRHAEVYNVAPKLVWSVIYEETYFRATAVGDAKEVGLMQVTPTVAREWAKETGLKEFRLDTPESVDQLLSDPEKNIQVGCWYLEQLSEKYRDLPAQQAMTLAAYNAGPSRVEEWVKDTDRKTLEESDFIERIKIASTKKYVTSILKRYRDENAR